MLTILLSGALPDLSGLLPIILIGAALLFLTITIPVIVAVGGSSNRFVVTILFLFTIVDIVAGILLVSSSISFIIDTNNYGKADTDFKIIMIASVVSALLVLLTGMYGVLKIIKWRNAGKT